MGCDTSDHFGEKKLLELCKEFEFKFISISFGLSEALQW